MISSTPARMTATPTSWPDRGTSPRTRKAMRIANSGDRLPSAPVMAGPTRRLASNVRRVTAAGNRQPDKANSDALVALNALVSSKAGASARKPAVVSGTLMQAPRRGVRWRSPSCVRTNDNPRPAAALRASAVTCKSMGNTGALEFVREGRHDGRQQARWLADEWTQAEEYVAQGRRRTLHPRRRRAGIWPDRPGGARFGAVGKAHRRHAAVAGWHRKASVHGRRHAPRHRGLRPAAI